MPGQNGQIGQDRQRGPMWNASATIAMLPFLPVLPFLPLLLSCKLTEVTIAPGQRVVVVQSVINRTEASQRVLVEYSQAGDLRPDLGAFRDPATYPRDPIGGARVTIEHQGGGPCAAVVDTLPEQPFAGPRPSGLYGGPVCPLQPGQQLVLRVETPAGEVVTASTTIPGASARQVTWAQRAGGLGYPLAFNRALDTVDIGVSALSGRALQVEARNDANLSDLVFFAFTDTLGMTVAGNLVNPFEGDSGETIFRAGRDFTLAVALTDTNYYDFLRSRSDPFTGRGFINHLIGGIGVFGSVETTFYDLHVVAPVDDPREGVYQLTGRIDTLDVNATLELYLDDVRHGQFSAFVRNWPVSSGSALGRQSGDGFFPPSPAGGMEFFFAIFNGDSIPRASYQLTGVRQPAGTPFPMIIYTNRPNQRATEVDTLTALQISGPATSARR